MSGRIVKLYNWSYIVLQPRNFRLCGLAVGHKIISDWTSIVTTEIVGFKDRFFISCSGTKYLLMEMNGEFKKMNPNAIEKLKRIKKR